MYVTVEDMRAEGVREAQANDGRLQALIEDACQTIDGWTGWFFEPRWLRLRLSGRQTATLQTPVPLISAQVLTINGFAVLEDLNEILTPTAPVLAGQIPGDVTLLGGRIFSAGCLNVVIEGLWGYTEMDGTAHGRTPPEIKRVCKLLVLRGLPKLTDDDAVADAADRWRLIEARTRDQSYKLAPLTAGKLTGSPEIDNALLRYRRPMQMGAA
jgi:hypothetical protein